MTNPSKNPPHIGAQLYRTAITRSCIAEYTRAGTDINQTKANGRPYHAGGRHPNSRVGHPLHPTRGAFRGTRYAVWVTPPVPLAPGHGSTCLARYAGASVRAPRARAKGLTQAPAARIAPPCPRRLAPPLPFRRGDRAARPTLRAPGLRSSGLPRPPVGPSAAAARPPRVRGSGPACRRTPSPVGGLVRTSAGWRLSSIFTVRVFP